VDGNANRPAGREKEGSTSRLGFGSLTMMNHNLGRLVVVFSFFGQIAGGAAGLVSDFHLMDVNPHSARYQAPVSPRDYLLQVSGYYFGHAT
jgi:hypothetical protein